MKCGAVRSRMLQEEKAVEAVGMLCGVLNARTKEARGRLQASIDTTLP